MSKKHNTGTNDTNNDDLDITQANNNISDTEEVYETRWCSVCHDTTIFINGICSVCYSPIKNKKNNEQELSNDEDYNDNDYYSLEEISPDSSLPKYDNYKDDDEDDN